MKIEQRIIAISMETLKLIKEINEYWDTQIDNLKDESILQEVA